MSQDDSLRLKLSLDLGLSFQWYFPSVPDWSVYNFLSEGGALVQCGLSMSWLRDTKCQKCPPYHRNYQDSETKNMNKEPNSDDCCLFCCCRTVR